MEEPTKKEQEILNKFKCRLFNCELEHPLVLGAGVSKNIGGKEGLEKFLLSANASLLMCGSISLNESTGNSGEVCWTDETKAFTINRMGMPNGGICDIRSSLISVSRFAKRINRKIGVSIAVKFEDNGTNFFKYNGQLKNISQYSLLANEVFNYGADIVELNLSCPNIDSKIISFQPEIINDIFYNLNKNLNSDTKNICVKLSPYSDEGMIKEISEIINNYRIINGVTTMNTFPNSIYRIDKKRMIHGGLSGTCVFPIALGQVEMWRKYLKNEKYIIGGGGVTSGQNVIDMLNFGANAVFMTSNVINNGVKVFGKVLDEMIDIYWEELS